MSKTYKPLSIKNTTHFSSVAATLLASLLLSPVARSNPVSIQGTATSENAVSIGSNSYSTAIDGIATGQGSVATGFGFSRDNFTQKVTENKAAVNAVNAKQDEVNKANNKLSATNNAINSLGKQIDDLTKQQQDIASRLNEREDLLNQKEALLNNVNDAQAAYDSEKNKLAKISDATGKNIFLDFKVILESLDKSVLTSSPDFEENRNNLAAQLKEKVSSAFPELAENYTDKKYRETIDGYLNRQAGYQGSYEYLANSTTDVARVFDDNVFFNDFYFNTALDKTDYSVTDDYKIYNTDSPKPSYKSLLGGSAYLGNALKKDGVGKVGYKTSIGIDETSQKSLYKFIKELNNQSVLNTLNLASLSKQKSQRDNIYTALKNQPTSYTTILEELNLHVGDENFTDIYNKMVEKSLDLNKIYFGIKISSEKDIYSGGSNNVFSGTSSDRLNASPYFYDLNIGILSKIKDLTTNNQNLISSQDITHFKNFYNQIQNYYKVIDWDFDKSAINLTAYRESLDKVLAYNGKIDSVLNLYQLIIDERKKADADVLQIDAWTVEMMNLKSEVLAGISDSTNFGMGIEVKYNKEWADYYLYYAKDESDAMIARINSELKLYNDSDELIKGVTSKAKEIQADFEKATERLVQDKADLEELNTQIAELDLTESEKTVNDKKKEKEQELADAQAEKQRLEDEIKQGEVELSTLLEELSKTELKNLGVRSQAHGSSAFASGDDSIAIGTNSTVISNGGIAIGKNTAVTGKNAIAIGVENTVLGIEAITIGHKNSILSDKAIAIGNRIIDDGTNANSIAIGNKSAFTKANPTAGITIQGIGYKFAGANPTSTVSIGTERNERQITNVAAGRITDTSTDAINGSQLYALVDALNSLKTSNLDNINNSTQSDVNINAGSNIQVTGNAKDGFTISATDTNTQATVSSESGITVTESDNENGTKHYTISAKLGKGLKIDDDGAIAATAVAAQPIKGGDGVSIAVDANEVQTVNVVGVTTTTDDGKSYTRSNLTQSVGIKGDHKNIRTTTATSGDVQVSMSDDIQVHSISVHNGPNITQNGINANNTRVSNVKDGVAPTDAVNVRQLNKQENALNKRIDNLANNVKKNQKRTDAGVATTAAMSNIPQVMLAGKSGLGVGVGNRGGQTALAIGYSRASDNAKHIIKLSAGIDTQSKTTFGAGYMYQW